MAFPIPLLSSWSALMSTDTQTVRTCLTALLLKRHNDGFLNGAHPPHLNAAATFRVRNDLSNQHHSFGIQVVVLSPTMRHDGTLEKHHRDNAVLEAKNSAHKILE